MDWFLYDNGLIHERVKLAKSSKFEMYPYLRSEIYKQFYVKLNFYDIIRCKTTAGSQNLMYILLNRNLNNKYNLCSVNMGNILGSILWCKVLNIRGERRVYWNWTSRTLEEGFLILVTGDNVIIVKSCYHLENHKIHQNFQHLFKTNLILLMQQLLTLHSTT